MLEKKVVLFDWYNTLSKSVFFEGVGLPTEDYLKIEQALFQSPSAKSGLINSWMRGAENWRGVMGMVSRYSGLQFNYVSEAFVESCKRMHFVVDNLSEQMESLKQRGYGVCVATDNMDSFREFTVPALGMRKMFKHIFNSYDLRSLKRDRNVDGSSKFFGQVTRRIDCSLDKLTLVDDSVIPNFSDWSIRFIQVTKEGGLTQALAEI